MSNLTSTHENTATPIVVIMVPGIRDFGEWTNTATELLVKQINATCVRVNYGWYDAVSFISPFSNSDQPYQKVLDTYEDVRTNYPTARICFVAHSFGTFLVGRLIKEHSGARLHRIVLCGSVLKPDFEWRDVDHRIGDGLLTPMQSVLNECGNRDVWPLMAQTVSSRYGDVGRHGFKNNIYAASVFFFGGHSCFFKKDRILEWGKFLQDGEKPTSQATEPPAGAFERVTKTVWWVTAPIAIFVVLIAIFRTTLFAIVTLLAIAVLLAVLFLYVGRDDFQVTNTVKLEVAVQRLCEAEKATEKAERIGEIESETIEWRGKVKEVGTDGRPYLVFAVESEDKKCKWTVRAYLDQSAEKAKNYQDQVVVFRGKQIDVIDAGGFNFIDVRKVRIIRVE